MTLQELGYDEHFSNLFTTNDFAAFQPARVIAEHKERYVVRAAAGEYSGEITGTLRFSARGREDFPAVGDWVAVSISDPELAVIHAVLPRHSVIRRQAVGKHAEIQVIAANIDVAFLVQAADRDFNINRLERYLTICYASNVRPIILLTKIDLIDAADLSVILERVRSRIDDVPVLAISSETEEGYSELRACIAVGKTHCLLGSSGVGKSTLLNHLSGKTLMRTDAISDSTSKGRHVTTHRELVVLDGGGILIDNPGMREVGIADAGEGLERTFDRISELSRECRFPDCTHTSEIGCRVLAALDSGELDNGTYENFMKMERERAHFESTVAERRRNEKIFGKVLKDYKKLMKKHPGSKF
ncbi:MAG: ribosome small subunit-dependent GTPase A [Bacteroidia bacterium]|nr:ribosome small subunit-dependent GTPase A [Bacteroidia bacterium]